MKKVTTVACFCILILFVTSNFAKAQNWNNLTDSAKYYSSKDDFSQALKFAKLALNQSKIHHKRIDTTSIERINFLLETVYYYDNSDSAEVFLRNSIEELISNKITIHPLLAAFSFFLGCILEDKNKIEDAEKFYLEALQVYREIYKKDDSEIASCLNALGIFYKNSGNLTEAEKFYKLSLDMYRRLYNVDNIELASTMCNLANYYFTVGNYIFAEPLYLESNAMRQRLFKDNNKDLANGLANYSMLLLKQSRFIEAEKYCKEAADMFQRIFKTDHKVVATMYNNLAFIYYNIGKFSEAESFYKKASEMRRKLSNGVQHDNASDFNNLAVLYRDMGLYSEAEPLFLKALELYRKNNKGDHYDIAKSLGNLATLFLMEGRFKEAEQFSNESLDMTRRLFKDDSPDLSKGINNHAMIMEELNRVDLAEKLFIEALEIDNKLYKTDNQEIIKKQISLGNLYFKQNKIDEAEHLYTLSLEMSQRLFKENHPLLSECLYNVAKLFQAKGKFSIAEKYYVQSLDIKKKLYKGNHSSIAQNMLNLAILYDIQSMSSPAEKYYSSSLMMYKNIYQQNSSNLSEKEKGQYWSTFNNYFNFYFSFAIRRMNENPEIVNDIFDNILFSKGLLLNSSLKVKNTILNSNSDELKNLFLRWQSQKEFLSHLYKFTNDELSRQKINRDSVEQYTNQLEKELASKSNIFSSELDYRHLSYKDIKRYLLKDESVVETIRFHNANKDKITDQITYAVLIVDNSENSLPKCILLNNGNYLDSAAFLIYQDKNHFNPNNFSKSEIRDLNKKYNNLYKVFWEPIQQHLKPYNKVFFSPDGVFNQLNLLTLQNPKTKKYLIEELNLVNITSTKDLLTRNTFTSINKFDSESDAVLIGFPNYHYVTQSDSNQNFGVDTEPIQTNKIGYDFSELPETKVEIANIENLLKNYKVKTKVLLGNSALEDSLKILRNPKILHIATHGFFLPETVLNNYTENNGFDILGTDIKVSQENPLLRSGLLFTGASGVLSNSTNDNSTDDGILTAFEAQNLILDRTELVVLSACETGSGELRNGEGVYGLQRAFKVAGARYLIMSLWKVDDKATQLMMSNFYQNWLNSKDIHESFRNAQNFIRKKYSSPYFWGAFVLVGV